MWMTARPDRLLDRPPATLAGARALPIGSTKAP